MPLVVNAEETAHLNYRAYRTGVFYFRIRFKNGQLSKLIEFSHPRHNSFDSILVECVCCGEMIQANLFFF